MWQNWANWSLIAGGVLLIIVEIVLGAATGFDFALVGFSLVTGGGIGLFFESTKIGLFSAGALAFIYLAFFRSRVRSKLASPNRPSNIDALIGAKAVVTVRITAHAAGQVKTGDETWRAALAPSIQEPREPGTPVTVESVDGVTLIVR